MTSLKSCLNNPINLKIIAKTKTLPVISAIYFDNLLITNGQTI